ncbi:MAG: 1-aminocyclopropane-1-carboxylate deaminase [Actinobacteria bacterium HGW-Actinobacteria-1]|jgi:D-cysteine desulfhydrase|nr:MAG: 1-aminocyclopropane-1-carboxylate deaminase [Actinobacteria bacterium HGW-Actinobacteria-1]
MTAKRVLAPQGQPGASPYSLFSAYPLLRGALPRVPLGLWPTPVLPLSRLTNELDVGPIHVKRDDVSALPYGGNKIRKLEILLGDALARGATDVITFGAVGSNHAFATALYGRALGLNVTSMLTPQPNAGYVRRNLLGHLASGASVRFCEHRDEALQEAERLRTQLVRDTGTEPYVIPFGGTTPMSTAGAVSAGLEFAGQVAVGNAPAPDVIYVTLGSMGTAAGVALGVALGGLSSLVRAVRVVPDTIATTEAFEELLDASTAVLRAGDPAIPRDLVSRANVEIVEGYLGEGYARFTPEGMDAIRLAALDGLHLDGTYTGKTMAALAADARSGRLDGMTTLFWDTYNSRDTGALVAGVQYRDLPEAGRAYFETDVQPLDNEGN